MKYQPDIGLCIGVLVHSIECQPILGLLNEVYCNSMESEWTQGSLAPLNEV